MRRRRPNEDTISKQGQTDSGCRSGSSVLSPRQSPAIVVGHEGSVDGSLSRDDGDLKFEEERPQVTGLMRHAASLIIESMRLMGRVPKVMIWRLDFLVRGVLHRIGVTSRALISRLLLLCRVVFYFWYCLLVWILPAMGMLVMSIVAMTWFSILLFYFIYTSYVPRTQAVTVPIALRHDAPSIREIGLMDEACRSNPDLKSESIRFLPEPLSFLRDHPPDRFTSHEIQCGMGSQVYSLTDSLIGGIPLPSCSDDQCNLEGMIPWDSNRSTEELIHSFIAKGALTQEFRGQNVDIGFNLAYESDWSLIPLTSSFSILSGRLERLPESIDWTIKAYGDKTEKAALMTRRLTTYISRPRLPLRLIRRIVDIFRLPFAPFHDIHRQLDNSVSHLAFLDIKAAAPPPPSLESSQATANSTERKGLGLESLSYLTVEISPPIKVQHLEMVIKPRLSGRSWYLATFPLSSFFVFWSSILFVSVVPLFLSSLGAYALFCGFFLRRMSSVWIAVFGSTLMEDDEDEEFIEDGDEGEQEAEVEEEEEMKTPLCEDEHQTYSEPRSVFFYSPMSTLRRRRQESSLKKEAASGSPGESSVTEGQSPQLTAPCSPLGVVSPVKREPDLVVHEHRRGSGTEEDEEIQVKVEKECVD